jgi:hypothetical protein
VECWSRGSAVGFASSDVEDNMSCCVLPGTGMRGRDLCYHRAAFTCDSPSDRIGYHRRLPSRTPVRRQAYIFSALIAIFACVVGLRVCLPSGCVRHQGSEPAAWVSDYREAGSLHGVTAFMGAATDGSPGNKIFPQILPLGIIGHVRTSNNLFCSAFTPVISGLQCFTLSTSYRPS